MLPESLREEVELMEEMEATILIPARYNSSRFPGKPLARILGKSLISRVGHICQDAIGKDSVYVVTDDERIAKECESQGIRTIISEGEFYTGTDRIASVSHLVKSKVILNVQGDEPCISISDIKKAISAKNAHPDHVINGFCEFVTRPSENSSSIPKVVLNGQGELIYVSRLNVPASHENLRLNAPQEFRRQVCVYAYTADELARFHGLGRRGAIEASEDIEILRCIELGMKVKMIELSHSLAVDYPEDIEKVEEFIIQSER
jgi:3-deoxy-manno-octulosonate cytidylyltransferase (CMP-KDO synthetase)